MLTYEFKRPQMEDKEIIVEKFQNYCSRSCDRTFVNTFLWARYYGVEYAVIENTVVFKSDNDGLEFTFPAGAQEDVKRAIEKLEAYCKELGQEFVLYNVTEDMFEQIEAWYPDAFEIEYNPDIADYVYECEKLTTLAGKKLHAKRNHINKFKATYENWSYETLSQENVEDCFQMALKWRELNGCEDDEDKVNEMCVTLNALRLYKELDLVGGVLKIDGNIVAFTLGEPICGDTFVVHIEKAFADIQGAYPMINQQFVSHECQDFAYINREEDTGSEGLRKAKLSYRPAFQVKKGLVKRK